MSVPNRAVAPTDLTVDEAKATTNSIRQHAEITLVYVKKAWDGRAWIALGYDSWNTYCSTEFPDHVRLPRDDRRDAVLELRDAGVSTRAIAAATGASRTTVISDIRSSEVVQSVPPDDDVIDAEVIDAPTTGDTVNGASTDGGAGCRAARHCWHVVICPGFPGSDQPTPEPKKITGTDGKKYTPPTRTPSPPRRREPITKEMGRVGEEFHRITNRLEKLADDDRFDLDLNGHLRNEVRRVHELTGHLLNGGAA